MTFRAGSSASARVAVSVTPSPSLTGFGAADRLTATCPSAVSSMVISTESFRPRLKYASGRLPIETVKVSAGCSNAASSVMETVAVRVFCPKGILTSAGPVKSSAPAVPGV